MWDKLPSAGLSKMRFQPFWIELRPTRQIQCIECEPLSKARGAVVFLELNAPFIGKGIGWKGHVVDRQYLVPNAALMGKDVLQEKRRANRLDRDPQLFLKLADDGCLCRLAEFDRTAEGAHALHASGVIQNLGRKKPVSTPVKTEGFQTNLGCRAPNCHVLGL